MGNKVAVVEVFANPYERWKERNATVEEAVERMKGGMSPQEALRIKEELLHVVATPTEAAQYMLNVLADNGLENHVDSALDSSAEYQNLRSLMPQEVPQALDIYQGEFSVECLPSADEAIKKFGVELAEGQTLFHGGLWATDSGTLTTDRPFSTSFCPQVALRNAEWGGKAYDAGRLDLMVVRVTDPKTKAFAYSKAGDHGNEKEVVFSSDAQLTLISETHVGDISVFRASHGTQSVEKKVPAYVLEIELS